MLLRERMGNAKLNALLVPFSSGIEGSSAARLTASPSEEGQKVQGGSEGLGIRDSGFGRKG